MGWRSPVMAARDVGLWTPLLALLAGLLLPAAVAFGMLYISGVGGQDWLRAQILVVLYVLVSAPLPALFFLPVLWGLAFALVPMGFAGLSSVLAVANFVGLLSAHLLLYGDLTAEAPWLMLHLAVALSLQGFVAWVILWWRL